MLITSLASRLNGYTSVSRVTLQLLGVKIIPC